jgi:hypothetical protein
MAGIDKVAESSSTLGQKLSIAVAKNITVSPSQPPVLEAAFAIDAIVPTNTDPTSVADNMKSVIDNGSVVNGMQQRGVPAVVKMTSSPTIIILLPPPDSLSLPFPPPNSFSSAPIIAVSTYAPKASTDMTGAYGGGGAASVLITFLVAVYVYRRRKQAQTRPSAIVQPEETEETETVSTIVECYPSAPPLHDEYDIGNNLQHRDTIKGGREAETPLVGSLTRRNTTAGA